MLEKAVKIKPVREKERYRCPFYGFSMAPGVFLDSDGNQCALETRSSHPCDLKINGKIPDWKNCYLNNESNSKLIKNIIDNYTTNASEFWPIGVNPWSGIPFKDFYNYIMNPEEVKRE